MIKVDSKKWTAHWVVSLLLTWTVSSQLAWAEDGNCRKSHDEIVEVKRQISGLHKKIQKLESVAKIAFPSAKHRRGVVFIKVSRKGFGEAWQDPSGMIWGDIVKTSDGYFWKANQIEAMKYCESLGARLPRRADFSRLRKYMGATNEISSYEAGGSYFPQIFLNVDSPWFWSSTKVVNSNEVFIFRGSKGRISHDDPNRDLAVRCVVQNLREK